MGEDGVVKVCELACPWYGTFWYGLRRLTKKQGLRLLKADCARAIVCNEDSCRPLNGHLAENNGVQEMGRGHMSLVLRRKCDVVVVAADELDWMASPKTDFRHDPVNW